MYTVLIILSLCLVADCKIGIQQVNKEGRCPDVIGDEVGICATECSSDLHCRDNMKCCKNGCGGFTCMQPVEEQICRIPCPRIYDPVCGSDGQTYSNECMMNFTTCTRNQEFISKEYDGPCQEVPANQAGHNRGPCEMELMEAQETAMIGAKIPQCDKDGYYKAKQCWGSIGMCWCADRNGNKINEPQRGKLTTEQCKILRANLQDSP